MENRLDLLKAIDEFMNRFKFTYDIYISEEYVSKNLVIIESMFNEHIKYGYNEKATLNLKPGAPGLMMKVTCKNKKLKLKISSKNGNVPEAEASIVFDLTENLI